MNIGVGTVTIVNDKSLELTATMYAGKKVQEGDMALFLVPMVKPSTANALIDTKSTLNQQVKSGQYKGQMLFATMQQATSKDVLQFMMYVYTHPDKYKAHTWRVSETFATWVINGAPKGS